MTRSERSIISIHQVEDDRRMRPHSCDFQQIFMIQSPGGAHAHEEADTESENVLRLCHIIVTYVCRVTSATFHAHVRFSDAVKCLLLDCHYLWGKHWNKSVNTPPLRRRVRTLSPSTSRSLPTRARRCAWLQNMRLHQCPPSPCANSTSLLKRKPPPTQNTFPIIHPLRIICCQVYSEPKGSFSTRIGSILPKRHLSSDTNTHWKEKHTCTRRKHERRSPYFSFAANSPFLQTMRRS